MDVTVLSAAPTMSEADALAAALELFAFDADAASEVGTDSGSAFKLLRRRGGGAGILVFSEFAAEDPGNLELETLAARHAVRADPTVPVAMPLPPLPHLKAASDLWTTWLHAATGQLHHVRLFQVPPGPLPHSVPTEATNGQLAEGALRAQGAAAARLGRALRGFTHPRAAREGHHLPWNGQRAQLLRPLLAHVADPRAAAMCAEALDIFDAALAPALPLLRHQARGSQTHNNHR